MKRLGEREKKTFLTILLMGEGSVYQDYSSTISDILLYLANYSVLLKYPKYSNDERDRAVRTVLPDGSAQTAAYYIEENKLVSDISIEHDRLYANFHKDPYIDQYGRIYNK